MPKSQKRSVPFDQILVALEDSSKPFPENYLYQFSDLDQNDLASLRTTWPQVDAERRVEVIQGLSDIWGEDTLAWFEDMARLALSDADPRVRTIAIPMLWDVQDTKLIPTFIEMMNTDPAVEVRTAAASALGVYVYLGELEEIPEEAFRLAETALLKTLKGQDDVEVRRHALESLGFSGQPEVAQQIQKAYDTADPLWLASALFAMGRSADETAWGVQVVRNINNKRPEIQFEAVRAAGELGLESARVPLLRILQAEDVKDDLKRETIWALSKIGGEDVRETFERLYEETEDPEEEEFIENALDNLSFTEDMDLFGMFGLDDNDESDDEDTQESTLEELIATEALEDEEEDEDFLEEDDLLDDEDKPANLPPPGEPPTSSGRSSKSNKKPYRHH